MSQTESNKTAVLKAFQCFTEGDLEGYLSAYHHAVIHHGYDAEVPQGIVGLRPYYQAFVKSLGGPKCVTEDIIAEGDQVAVRYSLSGKHMGPLNGLPPTGKPIHFEGQTFLRMRDGKIIERWQQADKASLMAQLQQEPRVA